MRRLWRIIQWLPLDSPLHRSVNPDSAGAGWDANTYLIALLAEICDVNNVILMHANSGPRAHIRDPIHIPRPGDAKPEAEILTGESLEVAMLEMGGKVKKRKRRKK